MAGQRFIVPIDAVASAVAAVLFEIAPVANRSVRLCAMYLYQSARVGDAQEEWLRVAVNRKTGAATTGTGTSTTPQPVNYLGTAPTAGFSAKTMMTTNGTGGTTTLLEPLLMNVRAGIEKIWAPEDRPQFVASSGATPVGLEIKLSAAPAESLTFSGFIVLEEEC